MSILHSRKTTTIQICSIFDWVPVRLWGRLQSHKFMKYRCCISILMGYNYGLGIAICNTVLSHQFFPHSATQENRTSRWRNHHLCLLNHRSTSSMMMFMQTVSYLSRDSAVLLLPSYRAWWRRQRLSRHIQPFTCQLKHQRLTHQLWNFTLSAIVIHLALLYVSDALWKRINL